MSAAFRLFVLMLCAFAAVFVYRQRSTEISTWLNPASAGHGPGRHPLVSPVEKVLEPEMDTAWIRLRGPQAPRRDPEGVPEAPPGGEAEDAGVLSQDEEQLAADLPLLEDPEAPVADAESPEESGGEGESGEEQSPEFVVVPPVVEGQAPGEPPAPPELPDGIVAYEEITYKVQEGESLWKIAQKVLGSGIRYREIYELNKAVLKGREDKIPPGTELKIRRQAREERLKKPVVDADTSVEGKSARGASAHGGSPKGKSKDSSKKIARRK